MDDYPTDAVKTKLAVCFELKFREQLAKYKKLKSDYSFAFIFFILGVVSMPVALVLGLIFTGTIFPEEPFTLVAILSLVAINFAFTWLKLRNCRATIEAKLTQLRTTGLTLNVQPSMGGGRITLVETDELNDDGIPVIYNHRSKTKRVDWSKFDERFTDEL